MKIALVHTDNNPHPRCGIFINHASPKAWLAEITRMQLKLSDCTAYVCPGLEANSIYGVLLILKKAHKNLDVGSNVCVQKAYNGFYLPEHTMLNMALTNEEYDKLLHGKPHFFHHILGMIELQEDLRWETILQIPEEKFPVIETPAKGVNIPSKVTAFSVEIEEKEAEEALDNPFGDSTVDPQDLPFDMKKVLQGNNKEVEKYLKYLEQNPEAALKMAVPLDMMGTSRGKAYAEFKFKSNFFESIGLGNVSEGTKSGVKVIFGIIAIIAVFWIGHLVVDQFKKNQIEVVSGEVTVSEGNNTNEEASVEELVIEMTETDNFNNQSNPVSQNNFEPAKTESSSNIVLNILLVFVIVALLVLIAYLAQYRKEKPGKSIKNKPPSWLDLPEDSELFSFTEGSETSDNGFYFGGNELSAKSKFVLTIIIVGLLIYLFYPMLNANELGILFAIFTGGIVFRLLYLLIRKNKTIIDEQE